MFLIILFIYYKQEINYWIINNKIYRIRPLTNSKEFGLKTVVLTQRGQTKFSNFFQCHKKNLAKGAMAQCPPKYATGSGLYCGLLPLTSQPISLIINTIDRVTYIWKIGQVG